MDPSSKQAHGFHLNEVVTQIQVYTCKQLRGDVRSDLLQITEGYWRGQQRIE
jgi:hypothetical protein